jgi:hypothetical protein
MSIPTQVNTSIRMSKETNDYFNMSFESSGANSKGEFINKLLESYNQGDPEPKEKIVEVSVDRPLKENQLLIDLTPEQYFALKETVIAPGFAESQNEIIDRIQSGEGQFFYFGNLFEPEFKDVWTRNIPMNSEMSEAELETAIKENQKAFLLNMFMLNVIEDKNPETVKSKVLKNFIRNNNNPDA